MTELLDYTCQAILAITGFTSLWLIASQDARSRMWGAAVGLAGEPFWLVTVTINEQWGIVPLCLVYAANWARIFVCNWRAVQ